MKHPIQPIVKDSHDVLRFKENKIVRYLLDNGGIDMNKLATIPFDQNDSEQFAQLIGYSVSGFGDLSYVSKETLAIADSMCLPENMLKSPLELQNEYLRGELKAVREGMVSAVARLFGQDEEELRESVDLMTEAEETEVLWVVGTF